MKKEYRIKKTNEIASLMKKRQSVGNMYFVVYYQKNHDQNHFRFAISVSKKYGIAVERNLMKRRIREIVKDCQIKDDVDFFVIAKKKAKTLKFYDMKKQINHLLKKAKILKDGIYEKQE